MNGLNETLMKKLTELAKKEFIEIQMKTAVFERKMQDKLYSSTKEIEYRLNEEIAFYNQKPEAYSDYKSEVLDKYKQEFEKIISEFRLQFINICEELQEAQINQMITIANCQKVKNFKDKYLNSEDFIEFKQKKLMYNEKMNNSSSKEELKQYTALLKNLKNPEEEYNKKIKAIILKVKGFDEIIEKCIIKMNECTQKANTELEKIVFKKTSQLQLYSANTFIQKLINRIVNLFKGKEKFETLVVNELDEEIKGLEKNSNDSIENAKNETIDFICQILKYKDAINVKYKKIMES